METNRRQTSVVEQQKTAPLRGLALQRGVVLQDSPAIAEVQPQIDAAENRRNALFTKAALGLIALTGVNYEALALLNADSVSAENVPTLHRGPEATDSVAGRVKPSWVVDAVASKALNVIAKQHGFTNIRPKKSMINGHMASSWGGKNTCRPLGADGLAKNPIFYFIKDSFDKGVSGVCHRGVGSVKYNPSYYPADHFTEIMDKKITRPVENRDHLPKNHGSTKSITSNLGKAIFTFNKDKPSDVIRQATINRQGRVVNVKRYKGPRNKLVLSD